MYEKYKKLRFETADVFKDIKEAMGAITNQRWECEKCGYTTYYAPWRGPMPGDPPRTVCVISPCPTCCHYEWEERTDKPV